MPSSETRYVHWDGVPNVDADGAVDTRINCKFALLADPEKYTELRKLAATLVVGEGTTKLVTDRPPRVRIKEVDEHFVPVEQLLTIGLRVRPVPEDGKASLLLRIYGKDGALVYQESFTGDEMRRMHTRDQRSTQDPKKPTEKGKANPRRNLQTEASRKKKGADAAGTPVTYTVRAWIAARKLAFARVDGKTTADEIDGIDGVISNKARGAHTDDQKFEAKHGDKLGRNQTEVRAPNDYKSAQCIGFLIKPGYSKNGKGQKIYRGKGADAEDLEKRIAIMKAAVVAAAEDERVEKDDSEVLKIFMAPEFFFRGTSGGYPLDQIAGILEKLRVETNKPEYKDWLFVFGTAIGYLKHEDQPEAKKQGRTFKLRIKSAIELSDDRGKFTELGFESAQGCEDPQITAQSKGGDWWISQGNVVGRIFADGRPSDTWLVYARATGFKAGEAIVDVPPPVQMKKHPVWITSAVKMTDKKYPYSELKLGEKASHEHPKVTAASGAGGWVLAQGDNRGSVLADGIIGGTYVLHARGHDFTAGSADLLEPVATEIFNVALVQKGANPAATVLVYKEFRSQLDFIVRDTKLLIHEENRNLTPTAGARAPAVNIKDAKPVKGSRTSELNKSGLGGGAIFEIDGITYGLEVCLDHGIRRLGYYYNTEGGKAGHPAVQVQLIPSWGMSINDNNVVAILGGLVFNVDGDRGDSTLKARETNSFTLNAVDQIDAPADVQVDGVEVKDYFESGGKLAVYEIVELPGPYTF